MSSPSFPPLFFLYLTLLWPVVVTIVCQRAESARSFLCDCIAFMPLRMLPWRPGVTTQRTSSTFGQPHVPQPQLQCPAVRDRQIASWLTLWCAMPSDGKALHKQWQPPYSPSHERVDYGWRKGVQKVAPQPTHSWAWLSLSTRRQWDVSRWPPRGHQFVPITRPRINWLVHHPQWHVHYWVNECVTLFVSTARRSSSLFFTICLPWIRAYFKMK